MTGNSRPCVSFAYTAKVPIARFSNSKQVVLEGLDSAVRHCLGSDHVFDFLEGSVPCSPAEGLDELSISPNECFAYCEKDNFESYCRALEEIHQYISEEGPFDGVMAFSVGCMVAAGLIRNQHSEVALQPVSPPFRCAIFFSARLVSYLPASKFGEAPLVIDWIRFRETIHIPTAHIWGANDMEVAIDSALTLASLCQADTRSVFVHEQSHEIPGTLSASDLLGVVKCIQRTMNRVM